MLCRPRTMETVKTFRLTASRSAGTVALVMTDLRSDQTTVRIYREDELYPVSKTHYADGANLFVDVLDLMDGYGPAGEPVGAAKETRKPAKASSITLRALTRRAQRLASDGTGAGVRFQDARDLWNKLSRHALTSVVRPETGPSSTPQIAQLEQKPAQRTRARRSADLICHRRVRPLQPAERRREPTMD